jgi:hypothetical protein
MALARWERPIQDEAGNLITNINCEVRREDVAGNPLASLYADRDGATPLANPFLSADGVPEFHAPGGAYKVRLYKSGYDQTFRYQAVGTGAEVDQDSLLIPGFLYEFEAGTTAPPSSGGIRANNAALNSATRLYVHKSTVAGSDISARIAGLLNKRALITAVEVGVQASWDVTNVQDQTTYYELTISGHSGSTSIDAGRVGLQREGEQGAAGTNGVFNGTEMVLTGASETLVLGDKGKTVILNRATAMTLALTAAATLGTTFLALLKNIGAGAVTIDPNGAETINGASTFTLKSGHSVILYGNGTVFRTLGLGRGDGGELAVADGGTGAPTAAQAQVNLDIASLIPGLLWGLTLSNNATDATNDIDVAVGTATDATAARVMKLAAGLTKRLDAAWAVGTNQGGRDTGAIADGTWHVWLIMRSDTGVVDVLFSLSASAPTMPTNYDYKRRIGSIVRASGAIRAFVQDGDRFRWSTPVSDLSAANPGVSAVTRTLTVPTGIQVEAIVSFAIFDTGSGLDTTGLLTDLAGADVTPTTTIFDIYCLSTGTDDKSASTHMTVRTNTSGQIRSRISTSTAAISVEIVTKGWIDRRGRDG